MHGGRATSSQVLPYIGATASEVKQLPGIVVTVERSGKSGRPATVFTIRGDSSGDSAPQPASTDSDRKRESSPHATAQPASAEREENRATVVRLDAYRPTLKRAPEPKPVKQPEPLIVSNPFRALL